MPEKSSISEKILNTKRSLVTPIVLALLIPVSAVSLYLLLGNTKALLPQPPVKQMELVGNNLAPEGEGHPRERERGRHWNESFDQRRDPEDLVEADHVPAPQGGERV